MRNALLAAALCTGAASQAAGAAWQTVHEWDDAFGAWNGRLVGDRGPNPLIDSDARPYAGRWVRFGGDVDDAAAGIQFWVWAIGARAPLARPLMSSCTAAEGPASCTGHVWVPPGTERLRLVVWASQKPGRIGNVRFDVATDAGATLDTDMRLQRVFGIVQQRYYRSAEADWPSLRGEFARVPVPPADVDPLPVLAQTLLARLPGAEHSSVRPATALQAVANRIDVPTCQALEPGIWRVHLPAVNVVEPEPVQRYVEAAHACMQAAPAGVRWVVDLRGNGGGNMHPMLAAIDALLPAGPLMTFVDGRGRPTGTVVLSTAGVAQNGQLVTAHASSPGRRGGLPVVVLTDPACASSCEVVAIVLRGHAGARQVGAPTAGLTTGNVIHLLEGTPYLLVLTESWMTDRCGRKVEGRLMPDVESDPRDLPGAVALLRALPPEVPRPLPCVAPADAARPGTGDARSSGTSPGSPARS